MVRNLFGEKIFCGLDVGSQRIKASLIKSTAAQLPELLGVFQTKTHGLTNFSVTDLGELTESIHTALGGLSKKTGVRIKDVYLGLGGALIETRRNGTAIPLIERGSKIIGAKDIKKLNNQARLLGIKIEEEVLHDFPQVYRVDDTNTAVNPFGLYGRKLEVKSLLIVSETTRLRNISKAVHEAGYEVAGMFFSSFAAAEVALKDKAKEDGCVLVDIGSQVTSVLIFKDGILKCIDRFNVGGEQVTGCLAKGLNLSRDLAEDIKKSYAIALNTDTKNEEEILIKRDSNYFPIKREDIHHIIEPEVSKLVDSIRDSITASGLAEEMNQGIFMVGGGSLLPGLIERIEEALHLPVNIGKVKSSARRLHDAASFSSSVGLAKLGLNESTRPVFSPNGHSNWSKSLVSKIKEFYQEYF